MSLKYNKKTEIPRFIYITYWLDAWIGLFENVVRILTLSVWTPNWPFKFISFISKKRNEPARHTGYHSPNYNVPGPRKFSEKEHRCHHGNTGQHSGCHSLSPSGDSGYRDQKRPEQTPICE